MAQHINNVRPISDKELELLKVKGLLNKERGGKIKAMNDEVFAAMKYTLAEREKIIYKLIADNEKLIADNRELVRQIQEIVREGRR